ncbi:MAG: glycosyl hydrolase family 57 [Gammaproteobacteria bacterium]|nr:glycosyl hydrolase family 57 [Gammaproteobacteria bacterium]NNJ83950.1 glycosyl hydrolase family 57 [Gammaproteobacteria bacterium]
MNELPEYIDGIPNISGSENIVIEAARRRDAKALRGNNNRFDEIKSAFAIALHMQQPLIPAGGGDLRSAQIVSNLKHMMDNQHIGDNHNAPVFHWCYKRIGDFIPQLVAEGKEPRIMLDYSGVLLHGLRHMGCDDVMDSLKRITCSQEYQHCVDWLGCPWGHAVAPSTPIQDYRLHVQAWQHHFAAIFGLDALSRVKGFSPSEMAIPNHPDVCYEFVKTLKDSGFTWVLIQEHTVENPETGGGIERPHIPHRLVARNSKGETASITALIKTQGSDTKLVAQMQPYYEAKSLERQELVGKKIPPLVSQIGDGENGGVMMNEFPGKYMEAVRESSGSDTPFMNGTEYLENLLALGITEQDFPEIQPILQKRIWDRMKPGEGPDKLAQVITEIKKEDDRFHMDGGSWTNNISWVEGYENVLGPMDKVSAQFSQRMLDKGVPTDDPTYRNALFHLLTSQTSCFRYWGQGTWTDYARELCRRAEEAVGA